MIQINIYDWIRLEKLRLNQYYYVDKTLLIKELIDNRPEVSLFTRPRRFGKSLNMSMLQHFFEVGRRSGTLFDVLKTMTAGEKYLLHMNHYPISKIGKAIYMIAANMV